MKVFGRVAAGIIAVVLLLLALMTLDEAYQVGIRGTGYNFGTEAMLFHGGRVYRSPRIYTVTNLTEGILFLIAAVGFGFVAFQARTRVSPFVVLALIGIVVHFVSIGPLK